MRIYALRLRLRLRETLPVLWHDWVQFSCVATWIAQGPHTSCIGQRQLCGPSIPCHLITLLRDPVLAVRLPRLIVWCISYAHPPFAWHALVQVLARHCVGCTLVASDCVACVLCTAHCSRGDTGATSQRSKSYSKPAATLTAGTKRAGRPSIAPPSTTNQSK